MTNATSVTMEQNIHSDPAHNLECEYRFTCGSVRCPAAVNVLEKPPCHVDRFKRYQPDSGNLWYYRSWEEVNRITWTEVFSFREWWVYILYIVIITTFIGMLMILIKVMSEIR